MSEIDPSKIAELQAIMGADFDEIMAGLLASIEASIGQIEEAIVAGDLETIYKAAHHCRNDALMVKARALLAALEAVEHAARDGRLEDARAGVAAVRDVWPATRKALVALSTHR